MIAQLLDIRVERAPLWHAGNHGMGVDARAIDFVRVHDVLANSHCTKSLITVDIMKQTKLYLKS